MEVVMAGALARPAGIDCCAKSNVENNSPQNPSVSVIAMLQPLSE
jgi:hypothetical protein